MADSPPRNNTDSAEPLGTNAKPGSDQIDRNDYGGVTLTWIEDEGTKNSGRKRQKFWHLMADMRLRGNRRWKGFLTERKNFGKNAKSYKRKYEVFDLFAPFGPSNRVAQQRSKRFLR